MYQQTSSASGLFSQFQIIFDSWDEIQRHTTQIIDQPVYDSQNDENKKILWVIIDGAKFFLHCLSMLFVLLLKEVLDSDIHFG